MKIKHDYRVEVGLAAVERKVPWPWTAAILTLLAVSIGWFAKTSLHAQAVERLAHRHAAEFVAAHPAHPVHPAHATSLAPAAHHRARLAS